MRADSRVGKFRSSLLARRIGSLILAAITVIYLALITYSFSDRLQSTRNILVFVLLWCLGIVAQILLLRSLRNTKKNSL